MTLKEILSDEEGIVVICNQKKREELLADGEMSADTHNIVKINDTLMYLVNASDLDPDKFLNLLKK